MLWMKKNQFFYILESFCNNHNKNILKDSGWGEAFLSIQRKMVIEQLQKKAFSLLKIGHWWLLASSKVKTRNKSPSNETYLFQKSLKTFECMSYNIPQFILETANIIYTINMDQKMDRKYWAISGKLSTASWRPMSAGPKVSTVIET